MVKKSWEEIEERAKENETEHVKETLWTNRIVNIIVVVLLVLIIGAVIFGYYFITNSLSPVDEANAEIVEVTIPFDSSSNDVSQILEEHGIVRNADIFSFYLRANNDEALQAGHYQFSPSMDANEVMLQLQAGGDPIFIDADTTLTIIEGTTLEDISLVVDDNTAISAEEFMETVQDDTFIRQLEQQFPSLLAGLSEREDLNFTLEGYLFPATYEYFAGMTSEELITEMVAASNLNYQRLVDDMANTYFDYHEILTLASLIENEAITEEDRGLVSGVFYNRLAIEMPLQTDVTILYALGEHLEFVTYEDLEVDSPYNTYQYAGLPPGPVSAPSYSAIVAAIYPTYNDFYYFVADIDTQEIYYSSTLEEHELLVEEYVNSRQNELETENTNEDELNPEETEEIAE